MNDTSLQLPLLPHHKLIAYGVAKELLIAVMAARIRDAKLRDEATRAAKSACLNCAEGAGRVTRADKARAFAIARGEAVEAAAAIEIAAACGTASEATQPQKTSRATGCCIRSDGRRPARGCRFPESPRPSRGRGRGRVDPRPQVVPTP